MKHVLLPDHMPVNKYELAVAGIPTITFTTVGALEEELDKIDLPDRTAASGGRAKPVEFDVKVPMHHVEEIAAMEAWYEEGQDPVSPGYQKTGALSNLSLSGLSRFMTTLYKLWVFKRATPELDMNNDGDMAEKTYTMCANLS